MIGPSGRGVDSPSQEPAAMRTASSSRNAETSADLPAPASPPTSASVPAPVLMFSRYVDGVESSDSRSINCMTATVRSAQCCGQWLAPNMRAAGRQSGWSVRMRAPREEPTPSRPAPTVQVGIAEALTSRTGDRAWERRDGQGHSPRQRQLAWLRDEPRCWLDQLGDQMRGSGGTIRLDVGVVDALADQLSDPGGDEVRVARRVVHAFARPIAIQPVAYMKVLLEVMGEREVEERALGRGQLHRRGQATLYDGQVAYA